MHINHKVLGVGFIALVLFAVYMTYATFTQKFADYEEVALETSTVGLNLPTRADVKVRGLIVGEVLEADPDGEAGAELTLGIYPEHVEKIPANVSGSIVPKTLFGEKYVSLVVPSQPSGHLQAGDTIEKTEVATEVEEVLNDLYPLLTAVQPAELNQTLNAMATALEGNGEQLGDTIQTADAYLKRLNPEIPALIEDLRMTAQVSDMYSDVLPAVAQILDNTIVTTKTLEGREERLQAMFRDVSRFSAVTARFLDKHERALIRLNVTTDRIMTATARYAPEFPCLTQGLVNADKRIAETFRGYMLHAIIKSMPRQPRKWEPRDRPRVGADRGPYCGTLPNSPYGQDNIAPVPPNVDDGVDEPTGKGTMRVPTGFGSAELTGYRYTGNRVDRAVLRSFLAATGTRGSDMGALLAGPLVGGDG